MGVVQKICGSLLPLKYFLSHDDRPEMHEFAQAFTSGNTGHIEETFKVHYMSETHDEDGISHFVKCPAFRCIQDMLPHENELMYKVWKEVERLEVLSLIVTDSKIPETHVVSTIWFLQSLIEHECGLRVIQ